MEQKKASTFTIFLWKLAGFEPEIVSKCKVDRFHASLIGGLLVLVGLYAAMAWTFFFQTISENQFWPYIGGFFMGFFIVSIDRALIASMAAGVRSWWSVAFRFVLALLLGVFLSQPMILKFYQPEIMRESQILADQKVLERQGELQKRYELEKGELEQRIATLQGQLDDKAALRNQAETDFKVEMDGSGGTGIYGYSTVAKQKERLYQRHQLEYETLASKNIPEIGRLNERINALNAALSDDMDNFSSDNQVFGTLIQAEALQSLIVKDESGTLKWRYYLLTLILTLIELSALIAKMLFSMPSYRSALQVQESGEMGRSDIAREILGGKLETYRTAAKSSELELMQQFFYKSQKAREEKMEIFVEEWKNKPGSAHHQLWADFKDKFLLDDDPSKIS